jgi:excisionase family DNA binding protein
MRDGRAISRRSARMIAAEGSKLFTVVEVAALLRTSRKAVYAMIERGQLPGLRRIGRRVLISREELLHWLDHNCASSPKG